MKKFLLLLALPVFMAGCQTTQNTGGTVVSPDKPMVEAPKETPTTIQKYPELEKGSKGEYVGILQKRLKELGYKINSIDEDFGLMTEAAVKEFQKDKNLSLQYPGTVGPKTWAALFDGATAPQPKPTPTPTPSKPGEKPPQGSIAALTKLADDSACTNVNWKDRGVPNKGYVRGLTLTFARQLCYPTPMISRPMSTNKRVYNNPGHADHGKSFYTDVIAHYELDVTKFSSKPFTAAGFGTEIQKGGLPTFHAMMTLFTGLGMRESSGRPFVGRDASADFTHENSAESGLGQGSYGLVKDNPEVMALYKWFQENPKACFKAEYYNGRVADAANMKSWGTPGTPGYIFQKFKKECPGFDVESTLMAMRYNGGGKGEWGPLRSKDAQVVKACATHYSNVQTYVENNLAVCEIL